MIPLLPRSAAKALAAWLGLPMRERMRWLLRKIRDAARPGEPIKSADRVLLEQQVLPAYAADPAVRSLLFIGCERYTRHYEQMFEPGSGRFRSLDIDPAKARYGAAAHVIAPMQDLALHFPIGSVDVIVCNGVYGFGLDGRAELVLALRASLAVLRPGGAFLLGWNDLPAFAPFDPSGVAFEVGLERAAASPAGGWRVRTDTPTRHTYDFYVRPHTAPPA